MTTAIIVPTPDAEREPARTCLRTVEETTDHLDVVVQPVVSSGPAFTFSGSINQGLEATDDADAWVLLNDDCYMDVGWLDAMLATADAHPDAGLVGALLRYPDGDVQHAGGFITITPWEFITKAYGGRAPFHAIRQMAKKGRLRDLHTFSHHREVRSGMRVDFLTAACLLVTRPCREAVGLFDEDFPMGAEDIDYCLRALDAGFELALAREATGVHDESRSTGGMNPTRWRSNEVLRRKWSPDEVERLTRGRTGIVHPPP